MNTEFDGKGHFDANLIADGNVIVDHSWEDIKKMIDWTCIGMQMWKSWQLLLWSA